MEDPRTGLRIIKVDPKFKKQHHAKNSRSSLDDKVIYWFGKIKKISRYGDANRRIAMVTDKGIFLCSENGGINRCIVIASILEIIHGPREGPPTLALRIGDPKDFDAQIQTYNNQDKSDIVRIIQRVHEVFVGARIPERELHTDSGEAIEEIIQSKRPRNWESPMVPLTPIAVATAENGSNEDHLQTNREHIRDVFNDVHASIHNNLLAYRRQELDEAREEMEGYGEMIAERDGCVI